MRRAVLLTGHFAQQKRRGSMLWVSDALQRMGWHVTLCTIGYSWLSRLIGDRRLSALDAAPETGTRDISSSLTALFGYAPLHPFSTRCRLTDAALTPLQGLTARYWAPRLAAPLAQADLTLIESGAPVLLAPLARRHASRTPMVYRVNDDMRLLGLPESLLTAERNHAPLFDRISTASPLLARRFDGHRNVTLDPMGLDHAGLLQPQPDPYAPRAEREVVCAGTTQFDPQLVACVAEARPNWRIHVLGRLKPSQTVSAITHHGEQPFATTLAHIRHADIGLAPYPDTPGIEYQRHHSNRMLLYCHFGLPILAPDRLTDPEIPSILGTGNLDRALFRAETWRRRPERLPDWSDLARSLAATL